LLAQQGQMAEAIGQWRKAVELNPKYAEADESLGTALYAQGKAAEALTYWRAAIDLAPNDAVALRQAAWVLATSPQAALRHGHEALALAVRAAGLSGGKDALVLDTLAAAYAETGRFQDAVLTARRALTFADAKLTEALKRRIADYQAGTAFRDQ
jgi:tetratricopeptide (TPR) repeat protein